MMEKRFLTVADVCGEADLNRKTVLKLLHQGHLRAAKIGRVWRVDRADFEQFVEDAKKQAVAL